MTPSGCGWGRALGVCGLAIILSVTACSPPSPEPEWPSDAQNQDEANLEISVILALNAYDDDRPKQVRYDSDTDRVIVTIYTLGEEFTESDLAGYREHAEAFSGGIEVVVELTDEDPPVEN